MFQAKCTAMWKKFSPELGNALTVLQLKPETAPKAVGHRNPVTCIDGRIQSRSVLFNSAVKACGSKGRTVKGFARVHSC